MAKRIDLEKVREYYEKSKARAQAERYSLERDWFRNLLYYLGIHWIIYSPQTRKWQPRKIAKWVPRPVTNKFASVATTIMQAFTAKDPSTRSRPATDSPEDIGAAQVGDKILPVLLEEVNATQARKIGAAWKVLTGTVIYHPHYDNDPKHGTTFVQHMQCASCKATFAPDEAGEPVEMPQQAMGNSQPIASDLQAGVQGQPSPMPLPVGAPPQLQEQPEMSESSCPKCGSPNVASAVDPTGAQIGEELPNGKMGLEVFSPFEVFMDLEARSMDEVQQLLVRRRYPLDVIKRRYGHPELESDNNSNTGGMIGLNLLRAVAYAAGNAMYGTGIASGRNVGDDQSVTVDQLWIRPCTDFPEGLVAVYANEKLLNEKDIGDGLPYRDVNDDNKPIWPWHLVPFDYCPGRIFGRTPLDDVAPKQEQRNKLESMIQLILSRTANPVWLIAKGLGVTQITGEPGQILEGNWGMDPRLVPQRIAGEGIQTSLIAWLEKIDSDIEELSGTFDVLRGNAPSGVTAGTALRLLLERANTRFTPAIKADEKAWEGICRDLLCIFQQNGTEKRIARIQGPGNTWEVQRFSKADIRGAVDIIVEAGSSAPKSIVGDQAMIQDLTTGGVINPADPNTQYKILEKFGSTDLLGDIDENIKYAQRENWKFVNEQKVPEINPIIDNHPVHLMIHKKLALSSDFEVMPQQQRMIWLDHIVSHQMAMMPPPMAMPMGGEAPAEGQQESDASQSADNGAEQIQGEPNVPPQQSVSEPGEPPLFPGA